MGIMRRRFKAVRKGRREVFTATVDTGADVTTLNLDTACELGLDEATAPTMVVKAPGNTKVVGYRLDDVELTYGKRTAKLRYVFVPTEATGDHREVASRTEEQLIGHDWLQASGAALDFQKHQLSGSIVRPRMEMRPTTLAERAMMRRNVCRVKRRGKARR